MLQTGKKKRQNKLEQGFTHAPIPQSGMVRGSALRNSEMKSAARVPQQGFTLLELVLVISLILLIAGFSGPLFRRTFSDLELKNTVYNLSKIINYAQEMAIIERTNYKIIFNDEENKYWLTKLDTKDAESIYKRIGGKYGRTFRLPESFTLFYEKEYVTLYPDGQADKYKIKIFDKSGHGYELNVKGFGNQVVTEEIAYE